MNQCHNNFNHYQQYLNEKNLSQNTVRVYLIYVMKFHNEIKNNLEKINIINFLNNFSKSHQPRSIKLMYNCIISYLKFIKEYELINELRDIRLPKIQNHLKTVIKLNEFNLVKNNIVCMNKKQNRNWLIFCILFLTGIRVSELLQIDKNKIKDNKIYIVGKGSKTRVIYIVPYLMKLINDYDENIVATNNNKKILTTKQINVIIKNIGINYFNKEITPHSLRRSYATNLLRNNVNLEVVRKSLGHSNINTTATYLQFTDEEILDELSKTFN